MKRAKNTDEYIAQAPPEIQGKLKQLRALIKQAAPQAEERISYGMPYFDYKGRLAYFSLMKNHIGLYIPPPIIEQHKEDLKNYTVTKSAIHLSLNGELPVALIKKLIGARMRWNEKASV